MRTTGLLDVDLMGSWPDVRVPDALVEDRQAVLDLVAEMDWKCQYFEGGMVLPAPRAAAVLSRPVDAECPDLRVWPTADVLAIFRFHADRRRSRLRCRPSGVAGPRAT